MLNSYIGCPDASDAFPNVKRIVAVFDGVYQEIPT